MRSNPALRAAASRSRIDPALAGFAAECRDTILRMLAYVGALALIGIVVFYAANPLTDAAITAATIAPTAPGWSVADRSSPAFAVSQLDWPGKSETHEVLRHPDGGRKDIVRIAAPGDPAAAEIEIYRAGGETTRTTAEAELVARMDPGGTAAVETAGVIDSKFGPVPLFSLTGGDAPAGACLGFVKPIEAAKLRISGFSCRGDTRPERRAAIACMLDRLVLLSAGGDAAIADVFARAELRRGGCDRAARPSVAADWISSANDPALRGRLSLN